MISGRYTDEFERKLSQYLEVKYCSLVNSRSSANLLAFMALTSPLLGERMINRGDEKGKSGYRVVGKLTNTDRVMQDSFWVGVFPGMTEKMIDYMVQIIKEAVNF